MLSDRLMVHIRSNSIKSNLTVIAQAPKLYRFVAFGGGGGDGDGDGDGTILASVTIAQFSI